ncbi:MULTISPECIES: CoA ester lyase [unclassified Amycolatopsis]|uniref:HpcH/HpaI aldolase/citrate lyase family protein n=1 Tax=unclassified Amycolatopsis TaxID=2618356 RepID=UPI0028754483|nr:MULTISPECIES: CoA ester lyase [unclassified Amycolatopsis]MDS0135942.1 CoA ester lyase [Amycolatopsis sp. 505]MDS0145469.1 CoA ester lyase [Amycolatopsis sp. CM201R]
MRPEATWLFVPGNVPRRFAKAAAAGADAVVIDLEDAVRPEDKDTARAETLRWLSEGGQAWVRLNAAGTPWFDADVDAVAGASGLLGVLVPKSEDPAALAALSARLDTAVVALVETAAGLHRVHDVAAAPGVTRLAFGSLDLAADLGADDTAEAMLFARSTIVLASRVAGLPAPIDGVTTVIDDADAVTTAARYARSLGFRGKLCIHPAQIAPTGRGLAPSEDEIAWARAVLRAAEGSAGAVTGPDGRMIDRPVLDRAHAILRF